MELPGSAAQLAGSLLREATTALETDRSLALKSVLANQPLAAALASTRASLTELLAVYLVRREPIDDATKRWLVRSFDELPDGFAVGPFGRLERTVVAHLFDIALDRHPSARAIEPPPTPWPALGEWAHSTAPLARTSAAIEAPNPTSLERAIALALMEGRFAWAARVARWLGADAGTSEVVSYLRLRANDIIEVRLHLALIARSAA